LTVSPSRTCNSASRPVICGLTVMWLVVTTPVSTISVGGRLVYQ
jgi:hypothetical protein